MTQTTFFNAVQDSIREVEKQMLAQADDYHPELHAALDLLLSSGGKRIRPALTLLTGRMLGADPDRAITLASAIELLHTATLVHDDLIDSSLLRRGNPTLNSRWSPGAVVLAGDFIFARAAKMAAATNSVAVMQLFSQTLTTIVNGEITQLFATHHPVTRESYYKRIYAKTASLFETSTQAAALISETGETERESMRRFGYEIGMGFQIIDDILDFTGEQMTVGKPVGSDLRQGIITLPTLYYIENHPDDQGVKSLLDPDCQDFDKTGVKLVESIRNSDSIQMAYHEADQFVHRGIQNLDDLPRNPEREYLRELALYIVERRR
ncbi:MAG: polyprenyl synthetase family protein [Chloroflexi bacterium]|nr:polyprenyl synthetase family protein [Chloroflexota bacterium]